MITSHAVPVTHDGGGGEREGNSIESYFLGINQSLLHTYSTHWILVIMNLELDVVGIFLRDMCSVCSRVME